MACCVMKNFSFNFKGGLLTNWLFLVRKPNETWSAIRLVLIIGTAVKKLLKQLTMISLYTVLCTL